MSALNRNMKRKYFNTQIPPNPSTNHVQGIALNNRLLHFHKIFLIYLNFSEFVSLCSRIVKVSECSLKKYLTHISSFMPTLLLESMFGFYVPDMFLETFIFKSLLEIFEHLVEDFAVHMSHFTTQT